MNQSSKKSLQSSQSNDGSDNARAKRGGTAMALLVGLTYVDAAKYDNWDGRNGCQGCGLDVQNMQNLLQSLGYQVFILLDDEATGDAVLKKLSKATKADPGDTFLFYYSGHGGQMPDQNNDELDGQDETLVCFDRELRDDDLNKIWTKVPAGVELFMISDSCNSGTNYRMTGVPTRPTPIAAISDRHAQREMKAAMLHIGGCRDGRTSTGYTQGGVFTSALVATMENGRFQGSWEDLHQEISAEVIETQSPQLNTYGPGSAGMPRQRALVPQSFLVSPSESRGSSLSRGPVYSRGLPSLHQLAGMDTRIASAALRGPHGGGQSIGQGGGGFNLNQLGQPGSREFNREVQSRLADFGLYDRLAVDGSFGPFSQWSLREFKKLTQTSAEPGIGPETARALHETSSDTLLPLRLRSGGDFASRIVRQIQSKRLWLCRHPACLNIVYLEGVGKDGVPNNDRPNVFNDLRILLRVDENGEPQIADLWEATTEPGKYWTENPMNGWAAARIAFGQFYAWSVGIHNDSHEALVQVAPVTVHRDANKDYERDNDSTETGDFGINQHWGYDLPVQDLGRSSAGCLVGRTTEGHANFMTQVKRDARYRASHQYRFTTTILNGRELPSA